MLDPYVVIKEINRSLEPFTITGQTEPLVLVHKNSKVFNLRISSSSSRAFNKYGYEGESVKVVKWFSDFWLYIEIIFRTEVSMNISLSVFQGKENDDEKVQLFRAEWDDYGDGSQAHAQPHWHFLPNLSIENTVREFAEIIPEATTFTELLSEENNNSIDISKFHFAMNGDWANSKLHIHQMQNEKVIGHWFGGLLAHLKSELEYIEKKS